MQDGKVYLVLGIDEGYVALYVDKVLAVEGEIVFLTIWDIQKDNVHGENRDRQR